MKLVIVESPTKAKTINKYLGKEFVVKSSYGHIRDLPVKPGKKTTLEETMGIDPSHGWKANYEILPGKSKVVKELKEAAKKADEIYLAADPDREGEAIAWHLSEILKNGGKSMQFHRVVYQEITKKAIQESFSHPGIINMNLVNAYKARRFLDRVVGFQISPLLWKYIASGLSAGRVQSVAVRLVVEREKEIKAFVPKEYWTIQALLSALNQNCEFKADVVKYLGNKISIDNQEQALKIKNDLTSGSFIVQERIDKPTKSRPSAPFVTSTLQQAASVKLNFGVKKTMRLAQNLYELGHITYMRTDSTKLSDDALLNIRDYVLNNFGEDYLPETSRFYASKAFAQEAHEAIRPSDISVHPDELTLDADAKKLYDLIWRQTLACQMNDAEFDTSSVIITAGKYELKVKGRVLKFDGWQKVLPLKVKEGEWAELPDLNKGEILELKAILPSQHFTKPPPRYSEASLVKELEKRGIGRPSTYAQIISTIQDRGYVLLQNKRFYAEKIGEIVTHHLINSFSGLMDYQFTANLEERLDKIAASELDWERVLNEFYSDFRSKKESAEQGKILRIAPVETPIICEHCGRPFIFYTGKNGNFLGCSGYKSKENKCKTTINLQKVEPFSKAVNGEEEEGNVLEILEKRRCPKCKMAMDVWQIDQNTRLHICGNAPICDGVELEKGNFQDLSPAEYAGPPVVCDKCGKNMLKKQGRFGPYFGCSAAPDCKNTRKILKSGEVAPPKADPIALPEIQCPKCKSPMVLRDGARGLFLACSKFPKCKGAGNVSVKVLEAHKAELDPKHKDLADHVPGKCPECDSEVYLHWSVKNKKYYFSCENKKCKWIEYKENRTE